MPPPKSESKLTIARRVAVAIMLLMMGTQIYGIYIASRSIDLFRPIFRQESVLDSGPTVDWQAVSIYVLSAERIVWSWTNLVFWLALVFIFEFSWRIGRVVFQRPAAIKRMVESVRLNVARRYSSF